MFSPRRLLAILCGLLVAGWVLRAPADGPDGPTAAPAGVTVEIEKADGSKIGGTFGSDVVRVKTGHGVIDLDVRKLRKLSLSRDEGDGHVVASATLSDKSHLDGQLLAPTLPVVVNGKTEDLDPAQVRVITFKQPRDTSLTAIVLGLVALTAMEIVLGVDNIIFLAIVAGKLPRPQQPKARRIGLIAALGTRILLLFSLSWLLGLTKPLFTLPHLPFFETVEARGVSWRDIFLLAGGTFLIGKSVFEMHEKLEHAKKEQSGQPQVEIKAAGFAGVIVQIAIIDIVFSLDSVITAVGMVEELWVMVTAMLIAVGIMMVSAEPIARFVDRRPTVKILALSFLILIGVLLVAEGLGQHIDKGYIYFAMAFAVGIELVNMRLRGSPNVIPGEMPGTAQDG
ncbi:MAG TPA: TerC family protein [Gemmataceae bacterium]|jgi:predicted tellurium resistance membrane protein TerC|nr:TerC family protein [Gemmataceae bacterium]